MIFSDRILQWYVRNQRQLPWRNTKNTYKIWLSEIILQQTRMAQGIPYYLNFISKYPSIFDLAKANEDEILKTWQGLGYYSRARNLHATAQYIAFQQDGEFPDTYEELLKLKGVGEYTASAIASICYNEARPVLDGNVYRVLSRCFDIALPIDSSEGKKYFKELAYEVMAPERIGDFNQGIMELGATVCLPKSPSCQSCPLSDMCLAWSRDTIHERPVKKKRTPVRDRYFDYLVFLDPKQRILLQKRTKKDIWKNLFEFPLIESDLREGTSYIKAQIQSQNNWPKAAEIRHLQELDRLHKLSHQNLHTRFWIVDTKEELLSGVPMEALEDFPVPVLIQDALRALKNSYF